MSIYHSDVRNWCTQTIHLNKQDEDSWGISRLRQSRPDLSPKKQWTGIFGETLVKEIFTELGFSISKPVKRGQRQPDLEVEATSEYRRDLWLPGGIPFPDTAIIEVKTGTYWTGGTALQKISAVPRIYKKVPELYQKPLIVVCISAAEKYAVREELLGEDISSTAKEDRDIDNSRNIYFMGFSELVSSFMKREEEDVLYEMKDDDGGDDGGDDGVTLKTFLRVDDGQVQVVFELTMNDT